MSDALEFLRGKHPELDDVPDGEAAAFFMEKYPSMQDDLRSDAKDYREQQYGAIRNPPSVWERAKGELASGARALAQSFDPRLGLKERPTPLEALLRGSTAVGGALGEVVAEGTVGGIESPRIREETKAGVKGAVQLLTPAAPGVGYLGRLLGRKPSIPTPRPAGEPAGVLPQFAGPSAGGPGFPGTVTPTPSTLTTTPAGPATAGTRTIPVPESSLPSIPRQRPALPQYAGPSTRPLTTETTGEVVPFTGQRSIELGPGARPEYPSTEGNILAQWGLRPKVMGEVPRPASGSVLDQWNLGGARAPLPSDILRNQAGRTDPWTAFLLARGAAGGMAGASQGEDLADQIRYGAMGAAVGVALDPRLVGPGLRTMRLHPTPGQATPFATALGDIKASLPANRFLELTPKEVARGIPSAENIVHEIFAASDVERVVATHWLDKAKTIYAPVARDPEAIARIHRALDGQRVTLSTGEAAIARQVRGLFDEIANAVGIPQANRIGDYFPHVREEVVAKLQLSIKAEGRPITKAVPQEYRPFFMKQRTLPTDASLDFGFGAVDAYIHGASRRIAIKGGFNPMTGTPTRGMLDRIDASLAQLPEDPAIQQYFQKYINDYVGMRSEANQLLSNETISAIKKVQFLRTIGTNIMSPINNSLQTINTMAKVDPRSWAAAWFDIFRRPDINRLARNAGVAPNLSKFDIEILADSTAVQRLLDEGVKKGGWLFQKTEETLRLHAFAAGYRDAQRLGLARQDAVEYAKNIVDETQFRFGVENLGPGMRQPGVGRLISQYKPYQINQMLFLKNLVSNDLQTLRAGRIPTETGKWLAAVSTIAGPTAAVGTTLGNYINSTLSQLFTGDPNNYEYKGIATGVGLYLGDQVGIGALPIENVRNAVFMLPGPAAAHALDALSVMLRQKVTLSDLAKGEFGKDLTPDEFAHRATRSVSIGADRVREAARIAQTPGPNVRASRTPEEAFALRGSTGAVTRPKNEFEATKTAIGLRIPEHAERLEASTKAGELTTRWKELVRLKSEAVRAGDTDLVRRINEAGLEEFGRVPAIARSSMKAAALRERMPRLERQQRTAPPPIRAKIREETKQ